MVANWSNGGFFEDLRCYKLWLQVVIWRKIVECLLHFSKKRVIEDNLSNFMDFTLTRGKNFQILALIFFLYSTYNFKDRYISSFLHFVNRSYLLLSFNGMKLHMHNKKLQRQRSFYLSITHSTPRRNSWYTLCPFLFSSQIQIPISSCSFRSSDTFLSAFIEIGLKKRWNYDANCSVSTNKRERERERESNILNIYALV